MINERRPIGAPPTEPATSPVKPSAPGSTTPAQTAPKPADAPPAAPQDQVPANVSKGGKAAPTLSLEGDPPTKTDKAGKPAVAADEILKGSNGPHNAFGPMGHETRDNYSLGMKDGFYRLGFSRERISGETHVGLLANTHGGGFDAGFMTRTPFSPHFSIAWGAQLQATMQKTGETTLIQMNPDILAQARYQTDNHRFTLNAGLYNRVGIGWNQGAVNRNGQALKDLEEKVKKEFDSLKQKAAASLEQLKSAGQTLLSSAQAAVPQARDKFLQLLQQRVQEQMPDMAGSIGPTLGAAVDKAFSAYMATISSAIGDMKTALQDASHASSPSQLQSALQRLATAVGNLQAATGPGALSPYVQQMQQDIGSQLGADAAAALSKLSQILDATVNEVGSQLIQSLKTSIDTAVNTAQRILTDLLGDGAAALQNSIDAADEANKNREQMTTVAASGRVGIGLDYQWRVPFLSSTKHDFNTVLDVGGDYYHPVYNVAWADKGLPNPLVTGAVNGPQADWYAGMRFTKWFGNVGVGANAGYRGTYTQGAGVQHAPEFGVSLSASF